MSTEQTSDIELVARILDNMPNAADFCVTSKEIAGFLRHQYGAREDLPKKRITPLLYHLKDTKVIQQILLDGKVHWFRTPEKGEKKWEGNIKKRLSVAAKKAEKASKNFVPAKSVEEELNDDDLLALATQMSLETLENQQKADNNKLSASNISILTKLDSQTQPPKKSDETVVTNSEIVEKKHGHTGLFSTFIANHEVLAGTRYGKAPFLYEEVLYWYQKHTTTKFHDMSSITGASIAILKKDSMVYLFRERPGKVFNLPGGKREIDETPYETLIRELKEEGVTLKDSFINARRFPDIITIGVNTETLSYGYNWTWVISEDKVVLPPNECKWVVPSEYSGVPDDAPWVKRVMVGLHKRGFQVYTGEAFTTFLMVFQFKKEGSYDSILSLKIPWNNMQ